MEEYVYHHLEHKSVTLFFSFLSTQQFTVVTEQLCLFQIDHHAREEFNLTSDGEFNAIKSVVMGKVYGK